MTTADLKAIAAAAWDTAADQAVPIEQIPDAPVPEGFSAFRVGRSMTALPSLSMFAPEAIQRRYTARILANCTGTCPMCSATAGLSHDPDQGVAAWRLMPVTVEVRHATGCPAEFGDEDRRWFPILRSDR